jgi:hypothetical protein
VVAAVDPVSGHRETPCAKCPWLDRYRGDADYLRPGRREGIVRSLMSDGDFPCHMTTAPGDYDDEGGGSMVRTLSSLECAGAMLVMLRADRDSGYTKIVTRLGGLNPDAFLAANADVALWTFDELTAADEDVETCSVVGENCQAPAGYMTGSGVVRGTVAAENVCDECGEPMCEACTAPSGLCMNCDPEEGDEW